MNNCFWDVKTTAEKLSLSRNTVYKLIHSGNLPSIKIGRKYLVPVDDLMLWMHENTMHPKRVEALTDIINHQHSRQSEEDES